MSLARRTFASIVLAAALGAGLAACGDDTATTQTPADPKAALAESTDGLQAGDYAFTATLPDSRTSGVVHVPSKSSALEVVADDEEMAGTISFRVVDTDRYMKIAMDTSEMSAGLGDLDSADPEVAEALKGLNDMVEMFSGKTWMHLDLRKVKDPKNLSLDLANPDATGVTALLAHVVTAQGDATTITGTVDATKVDTESTPWEASDFAEMGDAAKALPYTATLDDQGRLAKLVLDAPKSGETPAGAWTFEITGYGAQTAQEKPAADEITEAPANAYEIING